MNSNKSVTVVLIVSIALNLLLVGMFIGKQLGEGADRTRHFNWMTKEMDPASREKLKETMRNQFHATRTERQSLRAAQHALHEAIADDPYDPVQVATRLSELRDASAALQHAMHDQLVTTLGDLDREERLRVTQLLAGPEARPPGPGRGAHRPPP